MPSLELIRVALSLTLRVRPQRLEQEMGELVLAMGPNLAQQVHDYVMQHKLGYYPALDYFLQQDESIDPHLLAAAQHVAALVQDLVTRQIKQTLREPFSHVRIDTIQPLCFALPRVRPNDPDALTALAKHYSPYQLRIGMTVSSLEKHGSVAHQGYEKLVRHKLKRWLEAEFEAIDIVDARLAQD